MKTRFLLLSGILLTGGMFLATSCGGGTPPSKPSPATSPTPKPTASPTASPTPATPPATRKTYSQPPSMTIDPNKKYNAVVDTSLGSFTIELLAKESPRTVNNFVFLSSEGFYNGVIFHRIMKTFMIQSGDPTGTGTGSPGYRFADELPPKYSYEPGIVAMANSGPNTNGSQFFICTGNDSRNLNGMPNYTQFGRVVSGMDIVQKIASVEVVARGGETSKPVNPPVIKTITIQEK